MVCGQGWEEREKESRDLYTQESGVDMRSLRVVMFCFFLVIKTPGYMGDDKPQLFNVPPFRSLRYVYRCRASGEFRRTT